MIKNLKALRKEKGLSQQQLASILGISQQSINKYENHDIEPDISILTAMAEIFSTSVDYLIGNSSIRYPYSLTESELSSEEADIIKALRTLSDEQIKCIKAVIKTYKQDNLS